MFGVMSVYRSYNFKTRMEQVIQYSLVSNGSFIVNISVHESNKMQNIKITSNLIKSSGIGRFINDYSS